MASHPKNKAALYWIVLIGFILLTFVGSYPLTQGRHYEQGTSDTLTQTVVILLFFSSLPLLWRHRADAMNCIRRNPLLCALVAVCCLSILWSQYPEITLKRAAVLFIMTVVALALASATPDLRQFHTALFVALTAIMCANVLFTLILPSVAIAHDPAGVRGLYADKNTAGIMGMVATVAAGTWIAGTTRARHRFLGLLALLVCVGFLVVTKSKTSTAIALLALMVFYTFVVAHRFGNPVQRILLGLGFIGSAATLFVLLLLDFDVMAVVEMLIGDTSFTGRDELWAYVYKMASQKPVLGYGYGAFWDVGLENDPLNRLDPGTWLGDVEHGVINQAHNGYLELWLQMGLPVMIIAVVTVVATIAVAAWAGMSAPLSAQTKACFGMIAVMLCVYLLHNSMEASLFMRGQALCNFALLLTFMATHGLAHRTYRSPGASQ